jgi:hypothetical protein
MPSALRSTADGSMPMEGTAMTHNIAEAEYAQEEWRVIPGLIFSGFYEASSLGRIKDNVSGDISFGVRRQYYMYRIPRAKDFFVHRLVALAFLGTCPAGIVVNHIDLNKHNNRISNLEYVTQKRNTQHAKDHYLNKTPEAIQQIVRRMVKKRVAGWSYEAIGHEFSMKKDEVRALIQATGLQTNDDRHEYGHLKNPLTKYLFHDDDD